MVIKEFLSTVFRDRALQIEHVGSTSVEGMQAKPLIDVLVTVEKIENFEKQKVEMIKAGYEWGENYIEPNSLIFFKTGPDGEKLENIHICEKGSPKSIQFIQTRDYLRTHPARAIEYGNLKQVLKEKYPDDYPAYRAGKQSFVDETERLTYEWVSKGSGGHI